MKLIRLYLICIVFLLVLALASFVFIDNMVFHALLNKNHDYCGNEWVDAFRQLGKVWAPVWLLLIWLLLTRQVRPVLVALIALPLVFPIVYPAKCVIARPRPEYRAAVMQTPDKPHTFVRAWSSFPSGDTASVFALAAALAPYLAAGRYGRIMVPGIYSVASIIGLLRILAMKHYPSDVFFGAAVGVLAGVIAILIVEKHPNLRPHIYTSKLARIITMILVIILPFVAGTENVNSLLIFISRFWPLVVIFVIYAYFQNRCKASTTC